MTSWKRGDKNEDKGEKLMKSPEMGDKIKGAALKAAGEIEQGLDNVRDRVTGKQDTLQGDTTKKRSTTTRAKSTSSSRSKTSKSTKSAKGS